MIDCFFLFLNECWFNKQTINTYKKPVKGVSTFYVVTSDFFNRHVAWSNKKKFIDSISENVEDGLELGKQ